MSYTFDEPAGITIDINGNKEFHEYRDGEKCRKRVTASRGGMQVGCTFVTRAAMQELVRIWEDSK